MLTDPLDETRAPRWDKENCVDDARHATKAAVEEGIVPGGVVALLRAKAAVGMVGKINENKSETYGFDAQTEQYVDMLSTGIINPAKVVRVAVQDAASVAGLLITTEAMVAEAPKKEAAPIPGGGMGGMDY